ncbi:MAG: flippase-like domain-containing protein [Deltaproteobacteria bacterium]|nr:flippase-like domain-containing protein [Deltaproteobacteria bacterium]
MAGLSSADLVVRFRRWLLWGLAVGVLLYLAGAIWAGIGEMGEELRRFTWWLAIPILLLTTANYGLRFLKWHFFLGRLSIRVPWRDNLLYFVAGLAMVISPGKAGEVLKPWLVRARTGANLATSIPALVAERLTDGIAMLILAGFGVATYAGDKVHYVVAPAVVVVLGLALLANRRASMWILSLLSCLPGLSRVGHKLEEMYVATRTCLAPGPLVLAIAISVVAWWAECVGYWLVFRGFGVAASLDLSTFLYAFATIAGGAMPGGLGVADGALGGGAWKLVPEITRAQALASALLIRIATLWYGVCLGALALFRLGSLLVGAGRPEPNH